ncbi:hypothetical protein MSG28_012684 [Choristoneura fumiferana]|uniref:Uncharacterized protein n=1 Tax=Choristoneura fumiferana TaxID=7141 RepID=A0ACC0JHP2_CHOFU|nr:hypothetical protein MSG28_012684 [Choristoneura fumiferana]
MVRQPAEQDAFAVYWCEIKYDDKNEVKEGKTQLPGSWPERSCLRSTRPIQHMRPSRVSGGAPTKTNKTCAHSIWGPSDRRQFVFKFLPPFETFLGVLRTAVRAFKSPFALQLLLYFCAVGSGQNPYQRNTTLYMKPSSTRQCNQRRSYRRARRGSATGPPKLGDHFEHILLLLTVQSFWKRWRSGYLHKTKIE